MERTRQGAGGATLSRHAASTNPTSSAGDPAAHAATDAPASTTADDDGAATFDAAWPILAPFVGGSPATIVVVQAGGRILFANHGLNGERAEDMVGHDVEDLVAPAHGERVRAACARVAAAAVDRNPATETCEFGEMGPAGPTSWWHASVSSAAPGVALLVVVDVTTRKQREERLRRSEALLVDAQGIAHMGTWEWELSQPHATWSNELYAIYGLTPEEYTPSYEGYLKMVHPDDRQRVMDVTERAVKAHVAYSHDERIFRPDGTLRHLHTWAQPVLDEKGQLVRLIGVCQDITEQKKAEGAMRTQTLTRALARRLMVDLMRRAHVPESTVRQLGRGLVYEHDDGPRPLQEYVDAFVDMGLGNLRLDSVDRAERLERGEKPRYTFAANDLLERRTDAPAPLPTCFATLGYLEGVVSVVTGRKALGNEMRCQSMGHKECLFVVMEQ